MDDIQLDPMTTLLFMIIQSEAQLRNVELHMPDVATFCALYQISSLETAVENAEGYRDEMFGRMESLTEQFHESPRGDYLSEMADVALKTSSMTLVIEVCRELLVK